MQPVLNYGQDLFNTNFNADAATRLNNANNMAAIHGAIIGAVGSLAGAGMCWVARAVYGDERSAGGRLKWELVREWMLTRAPAWLFRGYMRYGERLAAVVRRSRVVRRVVRGALERWWVGQAPSGRASRLRQCQR